MRGSRGFSLIEMLTAVALIAVVLGGVFTALGAMQSGITDMEARQGLRLEAEHFLGVLREDLQYARWDSADTRLKSVVITAPDVNAVELQRTDSGQWVRYVFDRSKDELRRELFAGAAIAEATVLGRHLDVEVVKMPRTNNGIFDLKLKLRHEDNLGVVHDLERNLVVRVIQG